MCVSRLRRSRSRRGLRPLRNECRQPPGSGRAGARHPAPRPGRAGPHSPSSCRRRRESPPRAAVSRCGFLGRRARPSLRWSARRMGSTKALRSPFSSRSTAQPRQRRPRRPAAWHRPRCHSRAGGRGDGRAALADGRSQPRHGTHAVSAPRPSLLAAGFTLLEVLGVVLLTALVFTAAVNFYRDLSRKSTHAVELTRDVRFASAILDRVARDLEGTVLVTKPEAKDPLEHPWLFLAEARDEALGADHIKFMTRSHVPRTGSQRESDFEVVAYVLHRDKEGELQLLRWSSPQLPDGLDRSFPGDPAEGALVLARGVEGLRSE